MQKLELLTVNPEDLEEAEESEAVAKLVDCNHVNGLVKSVPVVPVLRVPVP